LTTAKAGATVHPHERRTLERIAAHLRDRFADRIAEVRAFGSRVRGDHGAWSDFDLLVLVRGRDPRIEAEIIGVIVDEEVMAGLSFAPVIKDADAFEIEKRLRSPFSENIAREGVLL
jgi:predicted nucleotidyltransferase